MTPTQIEELERLDTKGRPDPDGDLIVARNALPRLLLERKKLLEALRGLTDQLDGMRDFVCPDGGAESIFAAHQAVAFADEKG